jgi:hypothetical protein
MKLRDHRRDGKCVGNRCRFAPKQHEENHKEDRMMNRVFFFAVVAVCLTALPVGAAGLQVNASAAINGNYGLEVVHDGDTSAAFVIDDSPINEGVYRAVFNIENPVTFDFATALPQPTPALRQQAHHMIFAVQDLDNPAGNDRIHTTFHLKKANWGGGVFRFIVWAKTYAPTDEQAAGDGWVYRNHLGEAMEVALPTDPSGYPVSILITFQEETSPGANDGQFCLYRANNFAPGVYGGRCHTTLPNSGHNVDRALLGVVGGADATTTGSTYYDDFESYRTLITP